MTAFSARLTHHSMLVSTLLLLALLVGCTVNPTQPAKTPAVVTESPAPTSTRPTTAQVPTSTHTPRPGVLYRSDKNHLQVELPHGWAAAEGAEALGSGLTGLAAFNSWGETGFWPEGVDSRVVQRVLPSGGILVILAEESREGAWEGYGPEYELPDLSGFREDLFPEGRLPFSQGGILTASMYKWSRLFHVQIFIDGQAGEDEQAALTRLLDSWRFDASIPGDLGWAVAAAGRYLPEEIEPERFVGPAQEEVYFNWSEANEKGSTYVSFGSEGDGTIYIEFNYTWDALPLARDLSACPEGKCHTWLYQARPDGEVFLMYEGGAALPDVNRPTPTPARAPRALLRNRTPPSFLYVNENRIIGQRPGEEAETLAILQELGEVKFALYREEAVYLLQEGGFQKADLRGATSQVLHTFEQPLLFGEIQATFGGELVFYSATLDSSCGSAGFAGQVGVYDSRSDEHRLLVEEGLSLRLLGPSSDWRSLLALQVGCDPSFGDILLINLRTGTVDREITARGENITQLSPRARYYATLEYRPMDEGASVKENLVIYDLAARPLSRLSIELPEEGARIWDMVWSPDFRWLYFTLASEDANYTGADILSYGIWRANPSNGAVSKVAGGMPGGMLVITQNRNWLLARHPNQGIAVLLELESGATTAVNLPWPAVPGPSPNALYSNLSPDGEWLLVWHTPQGVASVVHLESGRSGQMDIPFGSNLIGWR